jgi:hypothetical protein
LWVHRSWNQVEAGRGKNLNELKHAMRLFIVVVEADKD